MTLQRTPFYKNILPGGLLEKEPRNLISAGGNYLEIDQVYNDMGNDPETLEYINNQRYSFF